MKTIILSAMLVLLFQIIHIFEEIALKAFELEKGKNPRSKYLRVSSVLVTVGFVILAGLVLNVRAAVYASFFLVLISVGNTAAHAVLSIKHKGKLGYGFPSSVFLGLAGLNLLWQLVIYLAP